MSRKPLTAKEKIADRIARSKEAVFLTGEFGGVASYDQVLRALRDLTADGDLVKLGKGVYARAKTNPITGQAMLDVPGGLLVAAQQALTKMGVAWEPSKASADYNLGRSTQIPVNAVLRIRGRLPRPLGYKGGEVVYEEVA